MFAKQIKNENISKYKLVRRQKFGLFKISSEAQYLHINYLFANVNDL